MPTAVHPLHAEATALVEAEFAGGARSVSLRSRTGTGMTNAAVLFAAEQARRGRCLVLCPRSLQAQFLADLARHAPDVVAGRWDGGANLVVADALQVDRRAPGAPEERFDAVVVEEFHPEQVGRVRSVLARYPEARVLEMIRMPKPYGGAIEPDSEIDLMDEPILAVGAPGR